MAEKTKTLNELVVELIIWGKVKVSREQVDSLLQNPEGFNNYGVRDTSNIQELVRVYGAGDDPIVREKVEELQTKGEVTIERGEAFDTYFRLKKKYDDRENSMASSPQEAEKTRDSVSKHLESNRTKQAENIGMVGAINIPGASSFEDAQIPITQLATTKSDLVFLPPTIDICGFLSGLELPEIPDIIGLIIPSIEEIIASVTGVIEKIVGFIMDAISAAIGFVGDAIDAIAAAIQSFIPSITCGAPIVNQALGAVSALGGIPEIGAAISPLTEVTDLAQTVIPAAPGGISPVVEVVSPDVTVKSIDDTLDAGEFT